MYKSYILLPSLTKTFCSCGAIVKDAPFEQNLSAPAPPKGPDGKPAAALPRLSIKPGTDAFVEKPRFELVQGLAPFSAGPEIPAASTGLQGGEASPLEAPDSFTLELPEGRRRLPGRALFPQAGLFRLRRHTGTVAGGGIGKHRSIRS
ncbi:hypothetical protein AGMMS49546_15460 [Spirochaetia bacterium]|nr:hypothetical protein AGMMS49546_15460 [Spirochaetia bacterium]